MTSLGYPAQVKPVPEEKWAVRARRAQPLRVSTSSPNRIGRITARGADRNARGYRRLALGGDLGHIRLGSAKAGGRLRTPCFNIYCMRNQFESLLAAARLVPSPPDALVKAMREAEKVLSQGTRRPELSKLSKALEKENPNAEIIFREDETGLFIYTEHPGLLYKLAVILGCPPAETPKPGDAEMEIGTHWQGHGVVDPRKLAGEIVLISGEFFCSQWKLKEIHQLATE